MDMEGLGYLIRDAREAKRPKMRQRELGKAVGLSPASISLIECGHIRRPSVDLLEKLARALDIPVQPLLEKAGLSLPDSEVGQVQWLVDELDAGNRRRLIRIGHALLQEQKDRPQTEARQAARP